MWVERLWQCWERGRSVEVRVKGWMKSRAEEWRRGFCIDFDAAKNGSLLIRAGSSVEHVSSISNLIWAHNGCLGYHFWEAIEDWYGDFFRSTSWLKSPLGGNIDDGL